MKHIPTWLRFSFLCLPPLLAPVMARAGRFEDYTRQYQSPPKPVRLERASYLGTAGTEWLCGAAFLPDGRLAVAGAALGPDFRFADCPITVSGRDAPAPGPFSPAPGRKGGDTAPDWRHPAATGFVLWLDAQTRRPLTGVRLPWGAGAITDLLATPDGRLVATGLVGPAFDQLGAGTDVSAEAGDPKSGRAFVLALDAGNGRLLWVRTFTDPGKGPRLRATPRGEIQVEGGWAYVFATDGGLRQVQKFHKSRNWVRGISPGDGHFALGYDRNTHTGREPWRQPHLILANAPGALGEVASETLYNWDPKLVGGDKYRLVSDSSFRRLYFAENGLLYAVGWSDGGNTVFERQPRNLDEKMPHSGLGFSSWGAGAMGLTHILKIDPARGKVHDKTIWCGFLADKDKPSSASITHLAVATDGSLLIAGGSAFGLIQTGDHLHHDPAKPGGPYIAILDPSLGSIRFSSTMNACGAVRLHDDGDTWRARSAQVNGRHLAVFVGGARAEATHYAAAAPAPARRPIQQAFAGGWSDGYLAIFDLGPAP